MSSALFHSQFHAGTATVISMSDNEVIMASVPNGLTDGQLEVWMDLWASNLATDHIGDLESVAFNCGIAA